MTLPPHEKPFWLQAVEDLDAETIGRMFGQGAAKYAKYLVPLRFLKKLRPQPAPKQGEKRELYQISRNQ